MYEVQATAGEVSPADNVFFQCAHIVTECDTRSI